MDSSFWDYRGSGAKWDFSVYRPVKKEHIVGVETKTIITFRNHYDVSDVSKVKVLNQARLKNWSAALRQ